MSRRVFMRVASMLCGLRADRSWIYQTFTIGGTHSHDGLTRGGDSASMTHPPLHIALLVLAILPLWHCGAASPTTASTSAATTTTGTTTTTTASPTASGT